MRRVYKYSLLFVDKVQEIELPSHAEVLHVEMQGGRLCMWALVDTNTEVVEPRRRFIVRGTGHDIDPAFVLRHVSTLMHHDGLLVWHIFEVM